MFANSLCLLANRLHINQLTNAFRAVALSSRLSSISSQLPVSQQQQSPKTIANADRKEVFDNVNKLVQQQNHGRLFAVVHLCGKQFKVTAGDIILVEGYWPPETGDQIQLDKVLVAGGEDFSLIGRPLLQKGLVNVQATIIEKTLTHTKTHFRKKRRKQYMRINFHRSPNTMLMINSIDVVGKVNQPSVVVNDMRVF